MTMTESLRVRVRRIQTRRLPGASDDQSADRGLGLAFAAGITRAVLLAMATVATRTGLRASHLAKRGSTASGLYFARLTREVMPTISSLRRYLSPILVI